MTLYQHLIFRHHLNDMAGYIIRLYVNNNLFATFRRMNAEVWFRQHKAIVWDIKDVLNIDDNGTYIDIYCSKFD